jgi:hypothetical protein
MSSTQLSFDLFDREPDQQKNRNTLHLQYRQAALKWLAGQAPSGIGIDVPTRVTKFQVDIGAFWSSPDRKRVMRPRKTVIMELRFERDDCWPDIGERVHLLEKLREIKNERKTLEAVIRKQEPHLRATDNLFEEIETWDYEKSANPDYQRCMKKLEEIQRALYAGSRFEQIRRAHVADFLYLAVPRHLIDPDELANGWGLLYINDDFTLEEVKKAQLEETTLEQKLHFIQNLAASCLKPTLFTAGVNTGPNSQITCTLPPYRRRKKL